MNADGTGKDILVGQDVEVMSTGTHIQTKKTEMVAAFLVDDLPGDDHNILVTVSPFSGDTFNRVEKMDVYTGRRSPVARSPVRNADYLADGKGVIRFAYGRDTGQRQPAVLPRSGCVRLDQDGGLEALNDELANGHVEIPLGFSADDRYAYLQVEQASGPDAIVAYDTTDGSRKTLLRDADGDPGMTIRALGKSHGRRSARSLPAASRIPCSSTTPATRRGCTGALKPPSRVMR